MNTEKLEKLKKSLDNKFIPDSMKDKIRTEIQKLESEIKQKEITPTEIKEEVKNIEEKVEDALEVAEKKEEKQEESKPKTTKKATTKTKKTAMALAKEIRKEGESWTDAVKRAGNQMKGIKDDVKKETKSEIEKLKSLIRKRKDLKGVSNSNLMRDGQRKAMPMGKRVSATGNTYYENRRNRTDKGKVGELYLENGGNIDYKHNYMMLSRLQMDCEYYLNYGNRNEKVLWAGNVDEQIEEMKRLWNSFPKDKKPEWLTMNQILDYEKQMKNSYADGGAIPNNYEGKTPEQVWNMFTTSQKYHFLLDHNKEIESTPRSIEDNTKKSYKFLPTKVKVSFKKHIETGEYANGGAVDGYIIVEGFDHYNNNPIYQVIDKSDKTDYVGEYHTTRKDAEEELKELSNSYANGGGVWTNEQRLAVEKLDADFEKEVEKEDIERNSKDASDLWRSGGFQKRMRKIFNKEDDDVYANGGMMSNMSVHDGTDFMNTPVYHRGGALPFENGGGFDDRDKQGMIYALQEHVSSGEIANMTDVSNYDDISRIRSKAIRYYLQKGDKPYSMSELKNVLTNVSNDIYADGGFMDGVYADGGSIEDVKKGDVIKINFDSSIRKDSSATLKLKSRNKVRNGTIDKITFENVNNPQGVKFYAYKRGNEQWSFAIGDMGIFNVKITTEQFENGGDFMSGVYADEGAMVNKDGIRVKSVAMPEKELTEAEWLAKHNESREARAYAVGGGIFADTFTGETGTHYTGLVGETNAMSSGEMFMNGGGVGELFPYAVGKDFTKENSFEISKKDIKKYKSMGFGVELLTRKDIDLLKKIQLSDEKKLIERKIYDEIQRNDKRTDIQKTQDEIKELGLSFSNEIKEYDSLDWHYNIIDNDTGEVYGYEVDNETKTAYPIDKESKDYINMLNHKYADGGAIANQQLIADAHLRPAEMFGREGIPAYKRGGRIKYNNGGEYSQYGKFIASQIEYLISLKTIASKKEPIQNLLKNMDDYRGTEIEKRITTDNLKYALQQKTVSKMNEVLRISLNALKD